MARGGVWNSPVSECKRNMSGGIEKLRAQLQLEPKRKKNSSPNQLAELGNFATRGTENLKLG